MADDIELFMGIRHAEVFEDTELIGSSEPRMPGPFAVHFAIVNCAAEQVCPKFTSPIPGTVPGTLRRMIALISMALQMGKQVFVSPAPVRQEVFIQFVVLSPAGHAVDENDRIIVVINFFIRSFHKQDSSPGNDSESIVSDSS